VDNHTVVRNNKENCGVSKMALNLYTVCGPLELNILMNWILLQLALILSIYTVVIKGPLGRCLCQICWCILLLNACNSCIFTPYKLKISIPSSHKCNSTPSFCLTARIILRDTLSKYRNKKMCLHRWSPYPALLTFTYFDTFIKGGSNSFPMKFCFVII